MSQLQKAIRKPPENALGNVHYSNSAMEAAPEEGENG